MTQLAHRTVLIIGGDARPDQLARLVRAFPDTTFRWHPTSEKRSTPFQFKREINDDAVNVVVILHGLARHGHTKGAAKFCREAGKPLLWCRRPTCGAIRAAMGKART